MIFASSDSEPNTQTADASGQAAPKRRRGRPRTFAQGGTVSLCVSIETRQKKWLDEAASSAPDQSASKIVREALDLWYTVHKEGKTLVGSPAQSKPWLDEADDYDYSWQ